MIPTEASQTPAEPAPRRARRWRWLVGAPVAALVLLAALTLSPSPGIADPSAPDAASVAAARGVLEQMTGPDARRGTRVRLSLSQRELDGLAELVSEALSPLRIEAQLARDSGAGDLIVRMSRELPVGLWVNITATARTATLRSGEAARPEAAPAAGGLPEIDLSIGSLPVPQALTYWLLERLWLRAQADAAEPIALADMIGTIAITLAAVRLTVVHPGRGAAMAGLAQARGEPSDGAAVAAVYCALAAADDGDLATLVRRAGALPVPKDAGQAEHNRALLTAVAMRAVPEYRQRLAGTALARARRCMVDAPPVTLAGRTDLAKHWALSAALTATLGPQMARSMGTWKELSDSTEGGSGFSFVDLAADRSGERFAAAAVDPQLARPVHIRLGAIREEQMLPRELLSRPEGLDSAAFERDYSATNSPEYVRALRAINRLLGNAGVP